MKRRTLPLLWCLIIAAGTANFSFAQNFSQNLSVVGCYSDLREIPEGIIGNGVIKITRKNGKYVGTFAELQNELGLVSKQISLENIMVDNSKLTIKFDLGTGRPVSGRITKNGIKMNWGENRGEYGIANSFMKRDKDCL